MKNQSIIKITNATCGYETKTVLHNINLEVEQGSYLGLVGPSGSGKTTLLRTIMGQVKPSSGRVTINGTVLDGGKLARGIGYVPQLETVDWNFPVTVEQVILMGRYQNSRRWLPWSNSADRQALNVLLEQLGLYHVRKQHIRDLSGGQQQRVFLARALISQPQLLLLDEPTSGVDVKTRGEILGLLTDLNRQGITIILTTHDLNTVASKLPQVVCINKTILAQGHPNQVFNNFVLSQTYNAPLEVIRHQGHLLVVETEGTLGDVRPLVTEVAKAEGH